MAAGGTGGEVTQLLYLPAPEHPGRHTTPASLVRRTISVSIVALLWPSMLLPFLATAPETVRAIAESISPALLP